MIASLRGQVISVGINRVIVEVNGVGYDVAVSLSTLESLPQGSEVFLHICTVMRENSLELFGFASREEKALFELLLTVGGIGPKTSLGILSGISPQGFMEAVLGGDVHRLTLIPGVGKKSAERIILELKEKIKKSPILRAAGPGEPSVASLEEDLISSLQNLGYKEKIAASVAKKVLKDADRTINLAEAVKRALKEVMKDPAAA
ncbi:MAG: Holliday junction branch migration protein RuvA [Desulfomonile tiedjei]|uniref:Holliday junction branch migration complex subunit RuvA n=1 Tax=Desulfomonile tiedjei TaxID=2358 RepID=A0A9D6V6Y7_9BACT|nr:Holliday junction branch migration protein RuvA [Desulfomonile tiedjei]